MYLKNKLPSNRHGGLTLSPIGALFTLSSTLTKHTHCSSTPCSCSVSMTFVLSPGHSHHAFDVLNGNLGKGNSEDLFKAKGGSTNATSTRYVGASTHDKGRHRIKTTRWWERSANRGMLSWLVAPPDRNKTTDNTTVAPCAVF